MNKHIPLKGSEKRAPLCKKLSKLDGNEVIQVTVRLSASDDMFDRSLMVAARQRCSRATYDKMFGATDEKISAVERFARNFNLTIVEKNKSHRIVKLTGSVQHMQEAFQVFLAQYEHHDGTVFRGRTGAIKIPSELAGIVDGVFGLDNRPQAYPRFRALSKNGLHVEPKLQSTSFNPNDLAPIYNFPPGDGSGQCVAIIELGGGYRAADLTAYFQSLGISDEVNVSSVSIDGAANQPSTSDGADGEVMLDIEVIGALAAGSKIVVYFAPNTDCGFLDAITAAVHDKINEPSVVSISWGAAEEQWTQQSLDAFNSVFQEAALLGVSVCAAAGDNGSNDNVSDGNAHVDFPASSPYVVACGGTTLTAAPGMIKTEVVWNDGFGGATGGGVSGYFVVPDYQVKNGVNPTTVNKNPSGFKGRGVPDVAAVADPATGYNVVVDGQSMVIGGTSAVAPLMSALIARINQITGRSAGFIHPMLYKAVPSNDIVSGNNDASGAGMGYKAAAGWDACTGIGSPIGTKLLEALTPAQSG